MTWPAVLNLEFFRFTILPGGSGGGWVQSLLPCPGSWSSTPPSPGSLSYLAVAEENGSRAYHLAQVVEFITALSRLIILPGGSGGRWVKS
jgi:hypothetical protein